MVRREAASPQFIGVVAVNLHHLLQKGRGVVVTSGWLIVPLRALTLRGRNTAVVREPVRASEGFL